MILIYYYSTLIFRVENIFIFIKKPIKYNYYFFLKQNYSLTFHHNILAKMLSKQNQIKVS